MSLQDTLDTLALPDALRIPAPIVDPGHLRPADLGAVDLGAVDLGAVDLGAWPERPSPVST